MTIEEAREILDRETAFNALLAEAKAAALAHLEQGGELSGYRIGYSRGHRKWTDEQAVAEIADPLTDKPVYNTSLLSPSQMEKLLGKKTFTALNHLVEQTETKVVCSEESRFSRFPFSPFQEI